MSYEGYEEFICENGHYTSIDSSYFSYGTDNIEVQKKMKACPCCGESYKWHCSVDQTNGYYADEPHTFDGGKKVVGFTDNWHVDHYGNKYASKILHYEPLGDRYKLIEMEK